MAENRKRLEHMAGAIRRLEKDEAKLRLRYSAFSGPRLEYVPDTVTRDP